MLWLWTLLLYFMCLIWLNDIVYEDLQIFYVLWCLISLNITNSRDPPWKEFLYLLYNLQILKIFCQIFYEKIFCEISRSSNRRPLDLLWDNIQIIYEISWPAVRKFPDLLKQDRYFFRSFMIRSSMRYPDLPIEYA